MRNGCSVDVTTPILRYFMLYWWAEVRPLDSTASRAVKQAIIAVICLITVEQGIKLVIARWYIEANIEIWSGVLRFWLLQNVNQT